MKRGGWRIGESNTTVLKNKSGEEEATRFSRKEKSISGTSSWGTGHLYSQQGEEGDKQCAVM